MRDSTQWQLTNDMCLCCMWAHHRVCMQSIGVRVCSVKNVMTSGCRKIDDLIKTSRLFFAPYSKGPLRVSNFALLIFSPSYFPYICPPPTPQPFFPNNISLLSNPSSLLFSQAPRWITGFRNTASVHCSFCLHSGGPWSRLWLDSDGEDGAKVNSMLSKVWAAQQTLEKIFT